MKRTGVIYGAGQHVTPEQATEMGERIREHFPGVKIAVTNGVSSAVFEFDDGDVPPPPPPPPPNRPSTGRH